MPSLITPGVRIDGFGVRDICGRHFDGVDCPYADCPKLHEGILIQKLLDANPRFVNFLIKQKSADKTKTRAPCFQFMNRAICKNANCLYSHEQVDIEFYVQRNEPCATCGERWYKGVECCSNLKPKILASVENSDLSFVQSVSMEIDADERNFMDIDSKEKQDKPLASKVFTEIIPKMYPIYKDKDTEIHGYRYREVNNPLKLEKVSPSLIFEKSENKNLQKGNIVPTAACPQYKNECPLFSQDMHLSSVDIAERSAKGNSTKDSRIATARDERSKEKPKNEDFNHAPWFEKGGASGKKQNLIAASVKDGQLKMAGDRDAFREIQQEQKEIAKENDNKDPPGNKIWHTKLGQVTVGEIYSYDQIITKKNKFVHSFEIESIYDLEDEDLRPDAINGAVLRHKSQYARVKYTKKKYEKKFLCVAELINHLMYNMKNELMEICTLGNTKGGPPKKYYGWTLDTVYKQKSAILTVSLEMLTQIATINNISLMNDDTTAFTRLNTAAKSVATVNIDRFKVLKSEYVVQDTVSLAYCFFKIYIRSRRNLDFPSTPALGAGKCCTDIGMGRLNFLFYPTPKIILISLSVVITALLSNVLLCGYPLAAMWWGLRALTPILGTESPLRLGLPNDLPASHQQQMVRKFVSLATLLPSGLGKI